MAVDVLNLNMMIYKMRYIIGLAAAMPRLFLRLYTVPIAPDCHTNIADLVAPTAADYADVELLATNWATGINDPDCFWYADYPVVTFTLNTGTYNIYGHGVYGILPVNPYLFWAQEWDAPFLVSPTSPPIAIALHLKDMQCP